MRGVQNFGQHLPRGFLGVGVALIAFGLILLALRITLNPNPDTLRRALAQTEPQATVGASQANTGDGDEGAIPGVGGTATTTRGLRVTLVRAERVPELRQTIGVSVRSRAGEFHVFTLQFENVTAQPITLPTAVLALRIDDGPEIKVDSRSTLALQQVSTVGQAFEGAIRPLIISETFQPGDNVALRVSFDAPTGGSNIRMTIDGATFVVP